MEEKIKKEPPYALYFFLLSWIIVGVSFWVVWFEAVELRPWKSYQAQYHELNQQRLKGEYALALEEFQSPEVQQRYRELKEQLRKAEEDFQNPLVQEEYVKVGEELSRIRNVLKEEQTKFQAARGMYLEQEYLFYKYQREEDKGGMVDEVRAKMAELDKEVAEIETRRRGLFAEEDSLKKAQSAFTVKAERYAVEIEDLEVESEEIGHVPVELKQIYMEDINKADRCESCHLGINSSKKVSNRQPFAQHPARFIYLENHPPGDFGCTFCHRGQGRATSSPEQAHGWVEHWPNPMLRGGEIQATCQTCHGDVQHIRGGDLVKSGSELIEEYGCYGCHKIAGYKNLREVGPELTEVGTKVNYSWMVSWLQDPQSYYESARMPKFDFSDEEAEAVTDYLFSMTRETRIDYSSGEIDWDLAEKGKAIFRQSRCSICHAIGGVAGSHKKVYAPDLGKVGSKMNREWLYRWIEDPKKYFPQTRMPRFRFTPEQILALVEYLTSEFVDWDFEPQYTEPVPIKVASIKKGKELVQRFGCFGCHDVKGMEEMIQIGPFLRRGEVTYLRVGEIGEKIGTELSSVGSKFVERFDYGKLEKKLPRDRVSYLRQKMKEPRSFRDDLRMPKFNLSDEEIEALVTLLVGFTDVDLPTRFKVPKEFSDYEPAGEFAKILKDVKCLNCHMIKGYGIDFAPDLSIEGSKIQEQWLRKFLKQPDIIRPLLKQMPQFNLGSMIQDNLTSEEIEVIIQYFKNVLVTNEIPEEIPENGMSSAEQIRMGRELYEEKGCKACHQIGMDGGAVGPNLSAVGSRLIEGYIFKHLENPQALTPDIVEPNYGFSEGGRINLARYLSSLKEDRQ